jgi:hypothetical protein
VRPVGAAVERAGRPSYEVEVEDVVQDTGPRPAQLTSFCSCVSRWTSPVSTSTWGETGELSDADWTAGSWADLTEARESGLAGPCADSLAAGWPRHDTAAIGGHRWAGATCGERLGHSATRRPGRLDELYHPSGGGRRSPVGARRIRAGQRRPMTPQGPALTAPAAALPVGGRAARRVRRSAGTGREDEGADVRWTGAEFSGCGDEMHGRWPFGWTGKGR